MALWPERLRQTFNTILTDIRPIAIYWGPNYSTVYNEAFSRLVGAKHPTLLGKPVEEAWPEAGLRLKGIMREMAANSSGDVEDEWNFFVERSSEVEGRPNWLEETHLKWSLSPIKEGREYIGFVHPVVDTTSARLWERRMSMLLDLGETLATARNVRSCWERTVEELAAMKRHYDIPLAVLYSVEDDAVKHGIAGNALPTPPIEAPRILRLEGSLGVPEDHPSIPKRLKLGPQGGGDGEKEAREDTTFRGLFREAISAQTGPMLLQAKDGTLPATFLDPTLESRGFGDPIRAAVCLPIRPTRNESVMGVLLLGLNPRRPYDNDYQQYVSLLSQKLTTSLASIVLLEEEARRGRNAAEQAEHDQAMLEKKLALRTREATESIRNFERVAEFVPVGMCFGDLEGNITFANDAWYRLTGYPPGSAPMTLYGFLDCIKDEDRELIQAEYEMLPKTQNATFEFRIKKQGDESDELAPPTASPVPRQPPNFDTMGTDLDSSLTDLAERHILATVKAEPVGQDEDAIRVLTCLTDVTVHKRATEEAVRSVQQSSNLSKLAGLATVGMYDMKLDGRLLGANNVFFEMCGLPRGIDLVKVDQLKPWETSVWSEDRKLLDDALEQMVLQDRMQTVEVRLKSTWQAEDGNGAKVVAPRWVQATLLPVRASDGGVESFTGCLSDVSLQKWQLEREKQRKEEAIESKRQQENFIDMTSHEMRNPLSAILQCADEISSLLNQFRGEMQHDPVYSAQLPLLDTCLEAADTIRLCAAHQKRIVDDILTLSKLDANLLAVTPITADPIQVVKEMIRMHEIEAQRIDITLNFEVSQSFGDLDMTFLDFDPSRLKQILINLLGNALKFTRSGPLRNVTVVLGASRTRPDKVVGSMQFIPRGTAKEPWPPTSSASTTTPSSAPIDSQPSLGDANRPLRRPYDRQKASDATRAHPGDSVFLIFEVKDTGKGLTEQETKNLFSLFVQASSRTHVKYGGSGLGLFISRRLTELQNGAIGVASQPGVGSTFAFYIEAYLPSEEALREARAEAATTTKTAATVLISLLPSPPSNRQGGGRLSVAKWLGAPGQSVTLANGTGGKTGRKDLGVTKGRKSKQGKTAATTKAPSISGIKGVLVVEDNLINQQITWRGLVNTGFTVDVANHGIECLEKLKRTDRYAPKEGDRMGTDNDPFHSDDDDDDEEHHHANCDGDAATARQTGSDPPFTLSMILMDMEMPVQDGLTCTRRMRELEASGRIRGGRIPIIAVSANARTGQILEACAAGCDAVLTKPFRLPELLEKMRITMDLLAGDKERE